MQGIVLTNIGLGNKICSFDVNEEVSRHEPWTSSNAENKKMLDTFIAGGEYTYNDSRGQQTIKFSGLKKDKTFIESLGEYEYDANSSEVAEDEEYDIGIEKNKKKRVIIYTLQN